MREKNDGNVVGGRYALKERMGSGPFGETWRAEDRTANVVVAVRVFSPCDAARRARYAQDAQNLMSLWSEPGIAAVQNYFEDGDAFYLVTEYLPGDDLDAYLRRSGRLPLRQTLNLLRPVMQAVQKLHGMGIVHGEIGAASLHVMPNGHARLVDFGSVFSVNGPQGENTIAAQRGFSAPEAYGDGSQVGTWTDVYSLAAVIWYCLTGRAPADARQRAAHDGLQAPSRFGVKLEGSVKGTLMQALAMDPAQRLGTVSQLMSGLEGQKTMALRPVVTDFTETGLTPVVVDATAVTPLGPSGALQDAAAQEGPVEGWDSPVLPAEAARAAARYQRSAYVGASHEAHEGGSEGEGEHHHGLKSLFKHHGHGSRGNRP